MEDEVAHGLEGAPRASAHRQGWRRRYRHDVAAAGQRVKITIPYSPRHQFMPFHNRTERWGVMVAHRRAGKTVACINDLIRAAILCAKQDGRYAYTAPLYAQAKDVAWSYLKRFTAPIPGATVHESELRVDLPNG